MPAEMPYMASVTNVDDIITKIRGAGTPPKFTHEFLSGTLGFRSSNDRNFIKVLKSLGMLDDNSSPTQRYNDFKSESSGGAAMAAGLREGWAPLFMADQSAGTRSTGELQDTFKTVTGKGDSVALKMATTFRAFAKHADFEAANNSPSAESTQPDVSDEEAAAPNLSEPAETAAATRTLTLRHDVHVHLPPTSDAAVYTAIFRAIREELLD